MVVTAVCRHCSAPTPRGARFCASCGRSVDSSASENERRQLTILFSDLVDSTGLSERLDPEDLRDLLSSYRLVCFEAIGHYEGHVAQFQGDGAMAFFGYPIAHEDDAVRAVRAALLLLEGIKRVNGGIGKRLKAELQVRVGLHTGLVVVGELGPSGERDRLAVGESVNVAARTQGFAEPNTIVISDVTARLVQGYFDLSALHAQTLKGFTRPRELFRVVRATAARTKLEAAVRLTPQVGRVEEHAALEAAWREVREGADRVIVVRGEAGIGKSRLVHQFRQTVAQEGATVLECFCSPLTQATAMAPVIGVLLDRIGDRLGGEATPQARLGALEQMVGEHSRFGADALPLLAHLLSVPGADDGPIRDLSPARRRTRTLEVMRTWVVSSAERVPLAVFMEDVHWADPSTLEFLDVIVRNPPGGRTLLCVTTRPEFHPQWPAERTQTIELERLHERDAETMIKYVAGGRDLPALAVKRIVQRSEGVPLFVEEVTKGLIESGALRLEGNRFALARPVDDQFLPATVQGSLIARFDRLGESRWLAQLGAAIGREFSYELIQAVANVPETELDAHLARLSSSELAFVRGTPPSSTYVFKHALIQDAIYGTLLKSERARVHERIFAALKERFPSVVEERPEIAAYHAERAGRRAEALDLLRAAGFQAMNRTALVEAVNHLAHAIELVDVLPEPARTAMEIDLQAAIGPAYMATLSWAAPPVERSSARLAELSAASGDKQHLHQAIWSLWSVDFVRGKLDSALESANRALAMAEELDHRLLRLAGHHAVGYTLFYRAEYAAALRHAEDGLRLFDLETERQLAAAFQLSSTCALWCYRAEAEQVLGLGEQAMESVAKLRSLLDDLNHAPSRAYSLAMQCFLFHARDDVDEVRRLATENRSLCIAEGFTMWIAVVDIFLAWANARSGGNAVAEVENIRAAKERYDATWTHITEIELTSILGETLILAGHPEAVAPAIAEALAIARAGSLAHYEPEIHRIEGDAALALGDRDGAAAAYHRAIESARGTGARALELRAASALDRLGLRA
jgi:class 3 adenylate cyclase